MEVKWYGLGVRNQTAGECVSLFVFKALSFLLQKVARIADLRI